MTSERAAGKVGMGNQKYHTGNLKIRRVKIKINLILKSDI